MLCCDQLPQEVRMSVADLSQYPAMCSIGWNSSEREREGEGGDSERERKRERERERRERERERERGREGGREGEEGESVGFRWLASRM